MTELNKFDDIEDVKLRTYNRVVFLTNLIEDGGIDAGRRYIELFEEWERKQLFIMQQYIKHAGLKAAQDAVRLNLSFDEEAVQADG